MRTRQQKSWVHTGSSGTSRGGTGARTEACLLPTSGLSLLILCETRPHSRERAREEVGSGVLGCAGVVSRRCSGDMTGVDDSRAVARQSGRPEMEPIFGDDAVWLGGRKPARRYASRMES